MTEVPEFMQREGARKLAENQFIYALDKWVQGAYAVVGRTPQDQSVLDNTKFELVMMDTFNGDVGLLDVLQEHLVFVLTLLPAGTAVLNTDLLRKAGVHEETLAWSMMHAQSAVLHDMFVAKEERLKMEREHE